MRQHYEIHSHLNAKNLKDRCNVILDYLNSTINHIT